MTFTLDTSGDVKMPAEPFGDGYTLAVFKRWDDLSPFTQGYIEALFADNADSFWEESQFHAAPGEERDRTFSDLAPETLARIIADCRRYARGFDLRKTDEGQREQGRQLWTWQQAGNLPGFPPLTVQLGDADKVIFA